LAGEEDYLPLLGKLFEQRKSCLGALIVEAQKCVVKDYGAAFLLGQRQQAYGKAHGEIKLSRYATKKNLTIACRLANTPQVRPVG